MKQKKIAHSFLAFFKETQHVYLEKIFFSSRDIGNVQLYFKVFIYCVLSNVPLFPYILGLLSVLSVLLGKKTLSKYFEWNTVVYLKIVCAFLSEKRLQCEVDKAKLHVYFR